MVAGFLSDSAYFVSLKRLRLDPQRVSPSHDYLNSELDDELDGGGRVLLVGDAKVFDLEMPILYHTCFDTCLFEEIAEDRTPEEVRAALASQGITHVGVHWGEIRRYRDSKYGFTDFVQPSVFDDLVAAQVLEPAREFRTRDGEKERRVVTIYRVRK